MVCQVVVTDGRIIMPAVKNTSGTLGHSVCRLLDVDFKIMSQSGGLYYFVFLFFVQMRFWSFTLYISSSYIASNMRALFALHL